MAKIATKLVGVLSAIAMSVVLSGCVETFGGGPNSISRSGEVLWLAVCEPIEVKELYGLTNRDNLIVDLKGDLSLKKGDLIELGRPVEGMSGISLPVRASDVQSFTVKFEGNGERKGDSWTSVFDASGKLTIPDDAWLQTNGAVTPDPCV